MAFHTAATRYFYAMGREGILSKQLGRTHHKWQSPYVASFFQSAVAAVMVVVFVVIWKITPSMQEFADFENAPYLELYGWFAILGTFWVLLMMGLSGLATIAVFMKPENRNGTHWFQWLVAPALSSLGLFYALYLLWSNIRALGGDIGVVVALPWLATAWVLIGLLLALVIKARRPQSTRLSAACSLGLVTPAESQGAPLPASGHPRHHKSSELGTAVSHVIGIDVGSQSIKGVLLDGTGAIAATGSAPLDMVHPANGWAEQDPESFTAGLADVIGQLRTRCPAASVSVLGLACQVDGVVAMDAAGQALRPAIIWLDRRAAAQAESRPWAPTASSSSPGSTPTPRTPRPR